ncbi:MAG: YjjG family noncanonical pyrimidine nucleotidase [Crocinitomicaceae bacterium]|nr:YjjG family noncanonical pyrimidine nucleotidase [Crocinitomicaceae bacterium]
MKRNLFFDLDRTLWDFEQNSTAVLQQLFDETQSEHQLPSFQKFMQTYKEINAALWVKYGKKKITKEELRKERFRKTFFKLDLLNDEISTYFEEQYVKRAPYQTKLFPNTLETLKLLKEDGYRMHIITNGFQEVQHIKLENCALAPFFDAIICSEEVGVNKPDIRIFQYALGKANAVANETVMIGDDLQVDVFGAERAGIHGVHFDSNKRFSRKNNDNRINDLSELPDLLPWILK